MYVRIAQFTAGDDDWDTRIAEVRRRMDENADSELGRSITRSLMLVDREHSTGAAVFFCDTEEQLSRVDELMNAAQPPGRGDTRVSVQLYEVALDSATVA